MSSDGLICVAAVRSRSNGRMHLCEVPRGQFLDSGDIALFESGEHDLVEEGLCVYSSSLVDGTTMQLIESITGFRRPLPMVRGRMVTEYYPKKED